MRFSSKKHTGKCCICGKKVFSDHSIYCLRCFKFSRQMNQRGVHAEAVKAIWEYVRKYGYVCYYTGMALDMENPKSPWYYTFDHRIPGDDRTVVLTCSLVNEMKSDMTDKEFRYNVHQLDKCFRTGAKFRKRKLVYWERLRPPEPESAVDPKYSKEDLEIMDQMVMKEKSKAKSVKPGKEFSDYLKKL